MGADWGFSKEDGLLTYRALISPVLGYAAPVWLPARSLLKHPVAPLYAVQNAALRSITGCHAASSVQHLHDECEMLQVFDHLAMQSSQFLANTRQPNHPSHAITSRPPGPRPDRKPTLQRAFRKVVEPFSTDGVIQPVSYKRAIGSIHTNAVKGALAKRAPNRVLGVIPPKIHQSEATLPRFFRTTMSQLCSRFCKELNSYKHMVNSALDERCPGCRSDIHSVTHLFSCSAAPTPLTPYDLWLRSRKVVLFLVSLPPPSLSLTLPR
jgi:hypothetical protein